MVRTLCLIAALAFLGTPIFAEVQVAPGDTVTVAPDAPYTFALVVSSLPSDTSNVVPGLVVPMFYALGHTKPFVGPFEAWIDGSAPSQYAGSVLCAPVVIERNGRSSDTLVFYIRVSGSSDVGPEAELPSEFALHQNYPNPFNPATTVTYDLPQAARVRLVIYNAIGQEVAMLVNEHQAAGTHRFIFEAHALPSGTYFYRLTANHYTAVKKLVILR